jgi:hypothetical protein
VSLLIPEVVLTLWTWWLKDVRHIVRELLPAGIKVRGTVRSEAKGNYLVDLFKSYDNDFEYRVVPEMTEVSIRPSLYRC